MATFWEKIRRDFPSTRQCTYLDHAAGGPIPLPVKSCLDQHARELSREGDFAWPRWMKRLEEARRTAARFIHADPDEIAFINSTSQGMNLAADLLARRGTVLTNNLEFPTTTVPWLWRGAKVRFQKAAGPAVPLADLKKHLTPKVKTVVTSFVQYGTGYRQDLESLGRIKGRRFLVVNATQGLGAFPVNVQAWKADFLCTNSYKWLMAGYGGGILYVRRKWLSGLKPAGAGWRSMKDADAMDNRNLRMLDSARRYEYGCPSFAPAFAVAAAMKYFMEIGVDKIAARILELTDHAAERLAAAGFRVLSDRRPKHASGILLIEVSEAQLLWKRLLGEKIFVTPRSGGLRLAPHFYNSAEEIDRFVKSLVKFRDLKRKRGKS